MLSEKGPDGDRHVPTHRAGCYYDRAGDCCLLCLCRTIGTLCLRAVGRLTAPTADEGLIGKRVTVPDGRHPEQRPTSVEGKITEVRSTDRSEPVTVTVTIESGERVSATVNEISAIE